MKTGWSFTGCLSASKLELQLLSVWRNRAGGRGLSCTHGCQNSWVPSSIYFSFQNLFFIKGLEGGGGTKRKTLRGTKEKDSSLTAKSIICIMWVMRWWTTVSRFCLLRLRLSRTLFSCLTVGCPCAIFLILKGLAFAPFRLVDLLNTVWHWKAEASIFWAS